MYPNFKLCKFVKTKGVWSPHYDTLIKNTETEFTPQEARELVEFYNKRGICNFLAAHPTQGICIYECRGVGLEAENVGAISGTRGFYYAIQDASNPLRILALARRAPSNIVKIYDYDQPFEIDLNPPPHDFISGIYELGSTLHLVKQLVPDYFENYLEELVFFKGWVYYLQNGRLYVIVNTTPRPYKNPKGMFLEELHYLGKQLIAQEGDVFDVIGKVS